MTKTKYVDFDYQRYLDGDEVFYRNEVKFSGEIFYSKMKANILTDYRPLIVIDQYGHSYFYCLNGFYSVFEGRRNADLVMLPKKKTLYISISKEPLDRKDCKFIQLEIEE